MLPALSINHSPASLIQCFRRAGRPIQKSLGFHLPRLILAHPGTLRKDKSGFRVPASNQLLFLFKIDWGFKFPRPTLNAGAASFRFDLAGFWDWRRGYHLQPPFLVGA